MGQSLLQVGLRAMLLDRSRSGRGGFGVLLDRVREEVVDHPVEEPGELFQLLRRPVLERELHTALARRPDPADGPLPCLRELDALRAAVLRVGYAGDVP